ncbi:MAG: response regulator [Chitinophagaceae bacterium]
MLLETPLKSKKQTIEKTRKVFLIDDDEDELIIFNIALMDMKLAYTLQLAKSGDDLFKLLETSVPDLIFLDLHMPGKSGITVLKMLRYNNKYDSIPIIIYSKLNKESFIDDCYQAKANYYIIKPVSVDKLVNAINKIINTGWEAERYPSREKFLIVG